MAGSGPNDTGGQDDDENPDAPAAQDRGSETPAEEDRGSETPSEENWGSETPSNGDVDPASPAEADGPTDSSLDRVRAFCQDRNCVTLAVVAVVVVALLARLVALGARPAHWDEARVAYWSLYTQETGHFAYRRIIHGPFIQHVDRWLFGLFGPSDFVMRLPVAIIGGLLPLSALLFRDRLKAAETVALSLFLAFNPVLLYYSRFMRSDLLVGTFMFVALGMLVRLVDRGRPRYLYGTALFLALAVASKENAVIYLLTWLGAGALVLDRALDRPGSDRTGIDRLPVWLATVRERLEGRTSDAPTDPILRFGGHAVGAIVLFGLVWLFMFAPRGDGVEGLHTIADGAEGVGLWEAIGDPSKWWPLLEATTDQFAAEYLEWGEKTGDLTFQGYQDRLRAAIVDGLLYTSAPLVMFAIAGFIRERYAVAEGRVLVFFLCYAAAASIVGYPIGLSIGTGWKWNNVHVLLPLSIPAAIGLATIYRWGREAAVDSDPVELGLTVLILLLVAAVVSWNVLGLVYMNPQHESNSLVQFGQPHDDLDPVLEELTAAAPGEDPDVLVYGNVSHDNSIVRTGKEYWNVRPTCADFGNFLPMQWYTAQSGVNATCARHPLVFNDTLETDPPTIVITRMRDDSVPTERLRANYTHVGNYSLRFRPEAVPTIVVYVRSEG